VSSNIKHPVRWRVLCGCLAAAAVIWTAMHVNWQTRGKVAHMQASAAADRAGERMSVPLPSGRIPVNTAQLAELRQLPGIGPVLAEEIIAEREAHGAFHFPEDLLNVRGIGTKKLAEILEYITME